MFIGFIIFAVLFLAYANGANDNFKGVATLFGSKTTSYKKAITWATVTTFLGSLASIFLAGTLIKVFSGKGLVTAEIAQSHNFILAVGLGAAITVFLATLIGMPVSTTHSLTGALVGSGILAVGTDINLSALGGKFVVPLLLSPIISILFVMGLYPLFRFFRQKLGVTKEMCVCVGKEVVRTAPIPIETGLSSAQFNKVMTETKTKLSLNIADNETCEVKYKGNLLGVNSEKMLDFFHFISAGIVSFARGLNDTPKIMALLLAVSAFDIQYGLFGVGIAIALGGLINARKVGELVSNEITPMNHGQGFTANLVTGILVLFASKIGVPVSTTHVSCGSLFGLGMVNGTAKFKTIKTILIAWVTTLPLAALIAGSIYYLLSLNN